MCAGNSAGGAAMSAQPAAMALLGIASNCAVSGCCTAVSPPTDLIACRPRVPSAPIPDNTTATDSSPWSRARDENSTLIGNRGPRGAAGESTIILPLSTLSSVFGGITYTQSGSMGMPFSASRTGIAVARCSNSARSAFWVGSRCCTTMMAMPLCGGTSLRNCSSASRPPAEAPRPTMRGATSLVRRVAGFDKTMDALGADWWARCRSAHVVATCSRSPAWQQARRFSAAGQWLTCSCPAPVLL